MHYNKLVRDLIPEYIRSKGGTPIFHVADEVEYWEKLKRKVLEEYDEFVVDESPEEMADLLDVLQAIMEFKGFDAEEVERIRQKKSAERGGFKKRIILDES